MSIFRKCIIFSDAPVTEDIGYGGMTTGEEKGIDDSPIVLKGDVPEKKLIRIGPITIEPAMKKEEERKVTVIDEEVIEKNEEKKEEKIEMKKEQKVPKLIDHEVEPKKEIKIVVEESMDGPVKGEEFHNYHQNDYYLLQKLSKLK